MKLLVTVKRVIDYNVQIRVKADGSGVEKDNVKMSMNPPDENAVEEALRIKVSIPFVASCDLRLNEPRYASLPNIMKAKKKPIDTKDASSLGINIEPRIEQIKVEEPPVRQKGIMVSDVAELVQKLKHEAKVI